MRKVLIATLLAASMAAVGCGGGGAPSASTTVTPSPSSANVSVTMGDAPGDRVLSFELTLTSIVLTKSDSTTVTLFSGSRRIEATHLAGTFLPITLASAPQGTYTKADITVSNLEVVFMGGDGKIHSIEDKTLTRTVTIAFSPSLVIGSTAVVLNLDLNVAASILLDPNTNTVTINPTIAVSPAVANGAMGDPERGELEHIIGTVSAIDTAKGQVTIAVGQTGNSMTLNTNSSTKFEIGDSKTSGLGALATGMLVRVEGATQADGSFLATEIEASSSVSGAEAEGIVTKVTGSPATQLTIIAQDGSGAGMTNGAVGSVPLLGSPVTVSITSNTKFAVDSKGISFDASTFPFDATHLSAGQRVEAESETQIQPGDALKPDDSAAALTTSGALASNKVKLQAQALVGTVSSFSAGTSGSQFTLTVDPDSAFALLSGSTQVKVTIVSATQTNSGVSVPPASAATKLRVRGLVFVDGTSFRMIALRITNP